MLIDLDRPRDLRCSPGRMTQAQMAAHLCIGLSTYRKLEAGDSAVALRYWLQAWGVIAKAGFSIDLSQVVIGKPPLPCAGHPNKVGFGGENAWISADAAKNAILTWPEESCNWLPAIHPIMLLEHIITDLKASHENRTQAGVEQAQLAVEAVARPIQDLLGNHRELDAVMLVERIARIAVLDASHFAFFAHGVDVMDTIKEESFSSAEFKVINREHQGIAVSRLILLIYA